MPSQLPGPGREGNDRTPSAPSAGPGCEVTVLLTALQVLQVMGEGGVLYLLPSLPWGACFLSFFRYWHADG